ncbi:hypothetical protein [Geodermatophilus sabuli]|uniref:RanBP2-type domain-containing protein n=1 Tax=Geodermatophilus sabuli TaxID=1564158 RepID=A0A285EI95_9ACTN|nr:hypothetical protein [Geodermatophilus sabuli]MBB3086602.1 hypothetical protein [Geodermatophilus sabuli]SNX97746.1 hypothetical protein SAMN06893097_108111 [Geodermatophilus sabuli]
MTTQTLSRRDLPAPGTRTRPRPDRSAWTCPNCQRVTDPPRKRCTDCGTSRY